MNAKSIVTHVLFVWACRYEWSFGQEKRNGYVGFVLFHTALALILVAPFAWPKLARVLLLLAFATVCIGANGAVYRYEAVALYRIPVHAITLLGVVFVFIQARVTRSRRTAD